MTSPETPWCRALFFALIFTGLAGCAAKSTAVARAASQDVTCTCAEPTRLVVSDSITLWLFAPREVRSGSTVPMRLELENTRPDWIEVELAGRAPRVDFVVTDAKGAEVWSVKKNVIPFANSDTRKLDAYERLVFPYTWGEESGSRAQPGPRLNPGEYQLHARLQLDNTMVETPKRALRIRS